MKPLQNRILVKRVAEKDKTEGGILIPDTARERTTEGKVIAVGPDTTGVKVEDQILFGKYGGTDITIKGEEYLIMREDDVLGIIE